MGKMPMNRSVPIIKAVCAPGVSRTNNKCSRSLFYVVKNSQRMPYGAAKTKAGENDGKKDVGFSKKRAPNFDSAEDVIKNLTNDAKTGTDHF